MATLLLRCLLMLVCAGIVSSAHAETWTGAGGAGNTNWNAGINWGGVAPAANAALIFPDVANKTATNNFPNLTTFGPITIEVGGYSLNTSGGSIVTLDGGLILNGSGSNATIALPLQLNSNQAFIVSQSNATMTLMQPISGAGGLTKSGDGMLTILGTHGYTGPTFVAGGSLNVTGTLPTEVKIISGALIGSGTVPGIAAQNQGAAVVSPGVSGAVGTLTSTGNVRLYATDTLDFLITGNATADKLTVNGAVNLGGCTIIPRLGTGYVPADDQTWVLIENDGADPVISGGDPSNYLLSLTIGGQPYQLCLVGGPTRNDVVLRREADAAPGTVALSIVQPGTLTPVTSVAPAGLVDLRIQVTGGSSGGTVSFWYGATFIDDLVLDVTGSGTLEDVPGSTFGAGVHAVTAMFEGTTTLAPKRSSVVPLTVTGTAGFALGVTPSGSSVGGANVELEVDLAPGVVGSILFTDNGNTLGTVALDVNGDASFNTTGLVAGAHSLQAFFMPSAGYITATSAAIAHTVTGGTTTAVTLTSSDNPAAAGKTITLTAAVSAGATGDVAFYDGAALLATRTIAGASATFTTGGLSAGTHQITARYLGSTSHLPDDDTLSQAITPPPGGGGSSDGGSEESGSCGLGGGTAALVLGLLMLVGLRLRRE